MKPFCDLISLFLSIKFDENYELSFWNEIFGCVNYLNIPYETVMKLPIYIRKFWIQKHNQQVEEQEKNLNKEQNFSTIGGESINSFAKQEQMKNKNLNNK